MFTIKVCTLDVWGHGSHECADYDCPCMKRLEDDENGDAQYEHDENRCDCSYDVNDVFSAGTFEAKDDSDEALFQGLAEHGYLRAGVTIDQLSFDNGGDGLVFVEDAETGEPLFQLHYET